MKPRSAIEILVDRACGVPDEPDADAKATVVRFATSIAIDVADFMCSFLDAGDAKAMLARQAAVDFVTFQIEARTRAQESSS